MLLPSGDGRQGSEPGCSPEMGPCGSSKRDGLGQRKNGNASASGPSFSLCSFRLPWFSLRDRNVSMCELYGISTCHFSPIYFPVIAKNWTTHPAHTNKERFPPPTPVMALWLHTTHCSTDQAIRCLFTAERTGYATFIILWLNKLICPCSEYPRTSSNAVPSPPIAAANAATRPAASKYS